jgi:hypothetical protein
VEEEMSIQDDIEALEKALEDQQHVHSCGDWSEGAAGTANVVSFCGDDVSPVATAYSVKTRAYIAACSPDRIRRLLDALKLERGQHQDTIADANVWFNRAKDAETKLSKAIELLKATRDASPIHDFPVSEVDGFLKEHGGE